MVQAGESSKRFSCSVRSDSVSWRYSPLPSGGSVVQVPEVRSHASARGRLPCLCHRGPRSGPPRADPARQGAAARPPPLARARRGPYACRGYSPARSRPRRSAGHGGPHPCRALARRSSSAPAACPWPGGSTCPGCRAAPACSHGRACPGSSTWCARCTPLGSTPGGSTPGCPTPAGGCPSPASACGRAQPGAGSRSRRAAPACPHSARCLYLGGDPPLPVPLGGRARC